MLTLFSPPLPPSLLPLLFLIKAHICFACLPLSMPLIAPLRLRLFAFHFARFMMLLRSRHAR